MQYLGEYRIDDYITIGCQLHRFSSGAVYAPTGNVTYTFYENNSTVGAPTGGNLAQLNSKTGLYTVRVQLTTAAGFEAGKDYEVHIEATVDSVAAAELLMFRIVGNPKVDLDTIKTQAITCGAGVTVLASVGTAATDTAQTGDSFAIVNHGTYGNSVIKTETAAILADTGTDGVVVNTFTTTGKAEINAEVDGALNTAIPGTPTADSINERIQTMDDNAVTLDTLAARLFVNPANKLLTDASNKVSVAACDDAALGRPSGTVQADAGNSTTTFKTNLSSATNDFYKDSWLKFLTGTLTGQVRRSTAYNGATKFITVDALTSIPTSGDNFTLINN